ncbi:MAG: hypothetical protein AAFQ17_07665 [Pseudomonadota bacterium]
MEEAIASWLTALTLDGVGFERRLLGAVAARVSATASLLATVERLMGLRENLGTRSSSDAGAEFAAAISDGSSAGTSRRPDRRLLETGEGVGDVLRIDFGAAANCGTFRDGLANVGGLGSDGGVARDEVTLGVVACDAVRVVIRDSPGRGSRIGARLLRGEADFAA